MRLLINSLPLLGDYSGIRRYTEEIIYGINRLNNNKDFDILYYYNFISKKIIKNESNNKQKKNFLINIKNILKKSFLLKKNFIRISSSFTNAFYKSPDIFWEPNNLPFHNIRAKKLITTLHDLSFIHFPEYHPKSRIKMYNYYFKKNIRKSDYIITGSNFTKKEIVTKLKIDSNRIKVIYHGIDHNIFKQYSDLEKHNFKSKNKLPENYILYVGSLEPRKNLITLLKAYNELNNEIKNEYPLIIASSSGWNNIEIMNLINKNKKNIIILNFMNNLDLALLYNCASLFVYPSIYEGFGLPPLESQSCGCPVITTNKSSLPELYNKSAIIVDAFSINELKNKILILIENNSIKKDLIIKGLSNSNNYNWKKSSQKHYDLFKKII